MLTYNLAFDISAWTWEQYLSYNLGVLVSLIYWGTFLAVLN